MSTINQPRQILSPAPCSRHWRHPRMSGRWSYAIASLLVWATLPQTQAVASAPETGSTWNGSFGYAEANRPVTPFGITFGSVTALSQNAESYRITGTITEPRIDFGPEGQAKLTSTFSGSWDGARLSFTKTYDYDGHTVAYNGTYREDTETVQGLWSIGDFRGPFTITGVKLIVSVEQFQNQLNDPAQRDKKIDAPITNKENDRSAYKYAYVIDQFDVQHVARYAVSSKGDTYCNYFARDVTRAMHAELPQGKRANDIAQWLEDAGQKNHGWIKVEGAGTAQQRANEGHPTLAIWENTSGPHGHIAVVRPGSVNDPRGDAIAQAGSLVLNTTHMNKGFGKRTVEYWYHP